MSAATVGTSATGSLPTAFRRRSPVALPDRFGLDQARLPATAVPPASASVEPMARAFATVVWNFE